jgi:thiol-disulfide isomerase/thioredoxin
MNTSPILKALSTILFLSYSIILNAQTGKLSFLQEIKYDKAILSGKITGMIPPDSVFKPIHVSFNNVVTADRMSYDIPVKKDGSFSLIIPVQCLSLTAVQSDYYENIIYLIPGEETRLEINYDSDQKKHVKLINSLGLTVDDAMNMIGVVDNSADKSDTDVEVAPVMMTPEFYSQRLIHRLARFIKLIESSDKLSCVAKQMATKEAKVWFTSSYFFIYSNSVILNYINYYKTDSIPKGFQTQIPKKSYYSVLKSLDLYDPVNFSASFYSTFLQLLLKNDTLAIPAIGEMPINTWLIKAKEILKDDIGADTGQFYDLLAGNAFAKQLNEMNPLSEIQKKNIQSYFINKSFVSILMDENEKVILLAAQNKNANIYEIDKSSENIMDSIVSKYKGKVVFVDFWATWCVPCMKAIRESECVRQEFEKKDVVFVYITDASSPRKTWEQKAAEIHGEQYYLTEEEMNTINKIYNFTSIPHYLIYDKSGVMKYNYGPFMGNENMRKWIEESF